jgi:GGDEF domain-containing protein
MTKLEERASGKRLVIRKEAITPPASRSRRSALSEAGNVVAELEQLASDSDQSMADRDQAAADADQRIADLEQAASDLELEANHSIDAAGRRAYAEARAAREGGRMARIATTAIRFRSATERHRQAGERDGVASRRDEMASRRDRESDAREATAVVEDDPGRAGLGHSAAAISRAAAAVVRANLAIDRQRASADRDLAARDREPLVAVIERTLMDEPSGAYGRKIGEVIARQEIARARATGEALALGVIRFDAVGRDEERHNGDPARASLERYLFLALQARMRPFDSVIRWSEEEFVCTLPAEAETDTQERLEQACADIAERHPGTATSVGVGVLGGKDDGLDAMVARARVDR